MKNESTYSINIDPDPINESKALLKTSSIKHNKYGFVQNALFFLDLGIILSAYTLITISKIRESKENDYPTEIFIAKVSAAFLQVSIPLMIGLISRDIYFFPFLFPKLGEYGKKALQHHHLLHGILASLVMSATTAHTVGHLTYDPQVKSGAHVTGVVALSSLLGQMLGYGVLGRGKIIGCAGKKSDYSVFLRLHQALAFVFLLSYTLHMGLPGVDNRHTWWKTITHPNLSAPFFTGSLGMLLLCLNVMVSAITSKKTSDITMIEFPQFSPTKKENNIRYGIFFSLKLNTVTPGSYMRVAALDPKSNPLNQRLAAAHPFSVALMQKNQSGTYDLGFIMDNDGDWKKTFYNSLIGETGSSMQLRVYGPHISPLCLMQNRNHLTFIAGGVGITPFCGYLSWLKNHPDKTPSISIVLKQRLVDIALFLPVLIQISALLDRYLDHPQAKLVVVLAISGVIGAEYDKAVKLLRSIFLKKLGVELIDKQNEDLKYPDNTQITKSDPIATDKMSLCESPREQFSFEKLCDDLGRQGHAMNTEGRKYKMGFFCHRVEVEKDSHGKRVDKNFSPNAMIEFAREQAGPEHPKTVFFCGPKAWKNELKSKVSMMDRELDFVYECL